MALREKYTKFLNDKTRKLFLAENEKLLKDKTMKIPQYAQYVCDLQIINRSKTYENDKKACYGFSPINFLCGIHKDGTMSKTLFEFGILNHFLKNHEGEKAIEVAEVMLIDLVKDKKTIVSFDIDKIDAELKRIEDAYLEEQKALAEAEAEKEKEENKKS